MTKCASFLNSDGPNNFFQKAASRAAKGFRRPLATSGRASGGPRLADLVGPKSPNHQLESHGLQWWGSPDLMDTGAVTI